MSDPPQLLWNRLEAAGCEPKGSVWKGSAKCPAHDDCRPSLGFKEGLDAGVAVLRCRAGCRTEDVVAALGMTMRDLFPDGHRQAHRPRELAPARDPVEMLLEACRTRRVAYRCAADPEAWLLDICPCCGGERVLVHRDTFGRLRFGCFASGCAQHEVWGALLGLSEPEPPPPPSAVPTARWWAQAPEEITHGR